MIASANVEIFELFTRCDTVARTVLIKRRDSSICSEFSRDEDVSSSGGLRCACGNQLPSVGVVDLLGKDPNIIKIQKKIADANQNFTKISQFSITKSLQITFAGKPSLTLQPLRPMRP